MGKRRWDPPSPEEVAERQRARRAWLARRLQQELDDHGELAPPWVKFPDIRARSSPAG